MALTGSSMLPLDLVAPYFSLPNTESSTVYLHDFDAQAAVNAMLAGELVPGDQEPSIGCNIT